MAIRELPHFDAPKIAGPTHGAEVEISEVRPGENPEDRHTFRKCIYTPPLVALCALNFLCTLGRSQETQVTFAFPRECAE